MADSLAFPVSPDAAGHSATTGKDPIIDLTIDSPDGGLLTLSGNAHFVFQNFTDRSGGSHLSIIGNLQNLQGTDTLGNSYVAINNTIIKSEFTNGATSITEVFSLQLIGKGTAPNQVAFFQAHATLAPDGSVVVDFSHGRSSP